MIPPKSNREFEKVKIGEFVTGTIKSIEYNMEHEFKGKFAKVGPAVRIVFALDGYKYDHKTRWFTFSYGEKTNLYVKYLTKLVEGAKPDMVFDLDQLKGMKVRTIWAEENDFQHIESIFPADKKIVPVVPAHAPNAPEELPPEPDEAPDHDEELPF